jgi:hypothetical protein
VLKDLPKTSLQRIEANKDTLGKLVNGWVITKGLGIYGTDDMKRAVVAAFGWPANRQEDAVYPYTEVGGAGQKLSGAHKYTLTFAKGQTPPVDGFWSITMYEIDKGWWFVPNALNKFTLSRSRRAYRLAGHGHGRLRPQLLDQPSRRLSQSQLQLLDRGRQFGLQRSYEGADLRRDFPILRIYETTNR